MMMRFSLLLMINLLLSLASYAYDFSFITETFYSPESREASSKNLRLVYKNSKQLEKLEIKGELQFEDDFEKSVGISHELRVKEFYLSLPLPNRVEMTLGRMHYLKGDLDEINPSDFHTPEDFRFFIMRSKAERSLGQNIALIRKRFDSSESDFYLIPYPQFSKLPPQNSPFMEEGREKILASSGGRSLERENSFHGVELGSLGFIHRMHFDNTEWGLHFYSGLNPLPIYQTRIEGGKLSMIPTVVRRRGAAFTLVHTTEEFVYRAEGAYLNREGFETTSTLGEIGRRDQYKMGVGVEHLFTNNLLFTLQYYTSLIDDYTQVLLQQRYQDLLTLRATLPFMRDRLKTSLEISDDIFSDATGLFWSPTVKYQTDQNWQWQLKGQFFTGHSGTLFGEYNKADQLSINLEMVF